MSDEFIHFVLLYEATIVETKRLKCKQSKLRSRVALSLIREWSGQFEIICSFTIEGPKIRSLKTAQSLRAMAPFQFFARQFPFVSRQQFSSPFCSIPFHSSLSFAARRFSPVVLRFYFILCTHARVRRNFVKYAGNVWLFEK